MSTPTGHPNSRVRVGPEPSVNILYTSILKVSGARLGALVYSEGKVLNMGGRTSKGACASRHSEAASGARRHTVEAKLRAAGGLGVGQI